MKAKEFAIQAHGDQRYGEFPYATHLQAVVMVLDRFGVTDRDIIDAAWLHDVLEDTALTPMEVRQEFGTRVTGIVQAVTNEPGRNRKERAEATYPKIRESGTDAVIVKLADRIANTEHSIRHNTRHLSMYLREFEEFQKALYRFGECEAMWDHLREISGGSR